MTDLVASAQVNGLFPDDSSLLSLRDQIGRTHMDAQRAILGDEGFRVWREYERTESVQNFVAGVAGATALAGQPLTGTQTDALLKAVVAASPPTKGHVHMAKVDWALADGHAAGALSAGQFAIYRSAAPTEGWSRQSLEFNAAMRAALAAEKGSTEPSN